MKAKVEISLSIIMRGASYLVFVLLVPKYVQYFNGSLEESGKWFVLVSTCNWLLAIDFGIGNSLRNRLIKIKTRAQPNLIKATVMSGVLANAGIAILLFVLAILALNIIASLRVINSEWYSAVVVLIGSICIQFLARTVTFIYYSDRKTYVSSLFNFLTNVLLYAAIEYGMNLGWGIYGLSIVYGVAINTPLVVAGIWMLIVFIIRNSIKSCFENLSIKRLNNNTGYIIKNGAGFFINQLLYLSLIQFNPIIISSLNGSISVVQYTALSTIFFTPIILINLIGNSVWSRVAESLERRDVGWALNALTKVLWISFIMILCSFIVAALYTKFAAYWWKNTAPPVIEQLTIYVFFIYTSALIMQTAVSNFACAIQKLSLQRRFYILLLIFKGACFLILSFLPIISWAWILIFDSLILFAYSFYQIREFKVEIKNLGSIKYRVQ